MPPSNKNIDYNSPDFKFPPLSKGSWLFKRGYLERKLLPIIKNRERSVIFLPIFFSKLEKKTNIF
jgi:hypothetical protein